LREEEEEEKEVERLTILPAPWNPGIGSVAYSTGLNPV
jgi:hypothetical protein